MAARSLQMVRFGVKPDKPTQLIASDYYTSLRPQNTASESSVIVAGLAEHRDHS